MPTNKPRVSICLPVCNGEKHLRQAVESALAQTEPDFELIIADDASTDGTWQLVEQLAAKDGRIKAVRNEDRLGLFQNYNRCLSIAGGQYIKLFAQDDLFEPTLLETMLCILESHPDIALVTAGKDWIDDADQIIKSVVTFSEDRQIAGRDVILYNMLRITNWVGEPSTTMFRSSAAAKGFDTSFFHWGDLDYWFQILRSGDLYYISRPLVKFRRHAGSTTSANLKGLFFVPDIFKLGEKYGDVLAAIGETTSQYKKRATEMIAMEVRHLIDEQVLTDEAVASVENRMRPEPEPPEYTKFRQAMFHSSAYLAELLQDLHIARETIRYRDQEIAELKDTVAGITNSRVWKMLAPLRNVRAR